MTPSSKIGSQTPERVDSIRLDLDDYLVWVSGRPIRLRPMEKRLLLQLQQSPNRIVRTEELIATLYGDIVIDAGRVRLNRLVADVRGRLGSDFASRLRTVHRIGLLLVNEDSTGTAPHVAVGP
jgi:DNA-binding response OmpR family regulator